MSLAEVDPVPVADPRLRIGSGAVPLPRQAPGPGAHPPGSRLVVAPAARAVPAPRRLPFVMTVLTLLAIGLGSLLVLNTVMQQNSFTVSRLTDQAAQVRAQRQALSEQVDRLQAPQALAAAAARQGLVRQTDPPILDLGTGTVTSRRH